MPLIILSAYQALLAANLRRGIIGAGGTQSKASDSSGEVEIHNGTVNGRKIKVYPFGQIDALAYIPSARSGHKRIRGGGIKHVT